MSTASEAWFKCIDPESEWGKVTLEGVKDIYDLKKAIKKEIAPELDAYSIVNLTIKAKQKDDDDNNAVEVDARRTLASIFESFGNDTEFLVSVPVPHSKSEQGEDRPSHRRGSELSDTLTVPHPHQQLIKVPVSTLGPPRQRPPEDDNSFRCWSWWKSLREMEVGGLETLEFPVDILGSEVFGSTIFVRDAYTHLFNIIAWNDTAISTGTPNKRSYIITGTPGIGKSFFGFYLIYRLAREFPDHNIEWQDNAVRVILFADGGINYQQSGHSIISVNSHGEGAFITNFTHCNTFYIADAIEPIAGRARRFVLVTSPKRGRYKELAKAPNVYKLGMPIWDELELERLWKLRFPSITESDWRGYFSKWGGVPRSTLEKTNSFYQEDLHNNCQAVDIDACMKWIGTNRYNSTSISGTVLHMTVTPEGKYEDFRVKFASLYIENIVVSYYERNMPKMITKYILDTEEDSVHASTRGYIFEAIAHRILTRGGKFQVRRLGDLTEETIALPKLVQQSFYSVDEIKPGFYSRPRSRTFETIDSLCIYGVAEHDSLFQITVGRQHSIKVNGLENLSGKLMGKVRFYFVVPGDVYPRSVNPQSYLNSAGQKHQRIPRWITEKVEQWVLKLDYSAF